MVNIDNLVNEWAYRCEKGYPDMDSPSDLRVLKSILKEQQLELPSLGEEEGYDPEIDRGDSKDIRNNIEKDLEVMSDLSDELGLDVCRDEDEKKLLALFRKAKADGSIKDERSKEAFFNRCDAFRLYNALIDLLKVKGFKANLFDKYGGELRDLTSGRGISDDDRQKFLDYITNPNKQAVFPTNQITGNLEDLMSNSGVPRVIVKKLITHTTQDDGKKGVGMGELALAIVFNNITDAPGSGDLALDDENFEIKGQGATLGAKPEAYKAKLETVKAFEKYGLYRVPGKGKDQLMVGDKVYNLNEFTFALADIYNSTTNKDELKALFRRMLEEDGGLIKDAIDHVFDNIDFTNPESIQQGASGAHFYNYVLKSKDGSPNFEHFLMHDKGEKTRSATKSRPTREKYVVGTGEYIYVKGTPGDMTDALMAAGALYQGVTFNNMRPRVGFGKV